VLRVFESDVLDGLSAVGRLPDAASPRGRLPIVRLAGSDVEDVRVLLRHVTSPIDMRPLSSKIGVITAPLLVVFHTPPCAVPMYQIDVFFS
jgi:hypothetical protein